MAKPIVTAAALRPVENGRMGLGDSVRRWLPGFKPRLAGGRVPEIYAPRTQFPTRMDMQMALEVLVTTFVVRTTGDPFKEHSRNNDTHRSHSVNHAV